jgi:hypothetical protein
MIRRYMILQMVAAASLTAHSVASAEQPAQFVPTPMSVAPPAPQLALMFVLKLRLPEGRGLAAQLLQAGVDENDAATSARIAAGHLGDGEGGCNAKIEISRPVGATHFRLERIELTTDDWRTIIERRQGQLSLASATTLSRHIPLV